MNNSLVTRNPEELVGLEIVDETRKGQILAIKDSIVFSYDATRNYAGNASKSLTEFSSDLLKTVKLKESPEVEKLITELMTGLEKVDATTLTAKKPNFIQRLFKVDEVKSFINRYEDIEGIIDTVTEKLTAANFQLMKDMTYCDRMIDQNKKYILELDNYIKAGHIRLQEEYDAIADMEAVVNSEDKLAVYELKDRKNEADRFERKLNSLLLLEGIAIQNLPQIDLIRSGNSVLIEKIDTSIENVIPLWQQQMTIAIELMRQKGALALQESVTNTTNRLIESNSEMLRTNAIEIAKALETDIVDIEVLKKSNETLIKTMQDIKTIQEEGRKARMKSAQELGKLQSKLNEQMLRLNSGV